MLLVLPSFPHTDGLSLLNEDGGLKMFFPTNSFVTNTMLTHTDSPRRESPGGPVGNDHIACYGANITWHNSSRQLVPCGTLCGDCGPLCQGNGGVGVDPPLNGRTNIHMYTESTAYVNQDLECRVSGGQSAFIGVYLKNQGELMSMHTNAQNHRFWSSYKHVQSCFS